MFRRPGVQPILATVVSNPPIQTQVASSSNSAQYTLVPVKINSGAARKLLNNIDNESEFHSTLGSYNFAQQNGILIEALRLQNKKFTNELESEKDANKTFLTTNAIALKEKEDKIALLNQTIRSNDTSIGMLKAEIRKNNNSNQLVVNSLNDKEKYIAELQQVLATNHRVIDDLKADHRKERDHEIASNNQASTAYQNTIDRLNFEIRERDTSTQKILAETSKLKEKINSLEQTLLTRDSTISSLQNQNNKLDIQSKMNNEFFQQSLNENQIALNNIQQILCDESLHRAELEMKIQSASAILFQPSTYQTPRKRKTVNDHTSQNTGIIFNKKPNHSSKEVIHIIEDNENSDDNLADENNIQMSTITSSSSPTSPYPPLSPHSMFLLNQIIPNNRDDSFTLNDAETNLRTFQQNL